MALHDDSNSNDARSHRHGHAHGHGHEDPTAWLPEAVLDGQVSIPPVLDRFVSQVEDLQPSRIIDLGCGPGVGTIALAERFPGASVVGLDINQPALDLATERAAAQGLSDRVTFVAASFDDGFVDAVAPADLLWASMSLHHTEDPAAALGHACAVVSPGGRLALAEFGAPVTMLPDTSDVVTGGTWDRFQAASDAGLLDHLGPAAFNVQWLDLLAEQGIEQIAHFECPIRFPAPLGAQEREWLTTHLQRGLQFTEERISAEDRALLQALLDPENPDGTASSDSVFIDYGRTLYTGVKP